MKAQMRFQKIICLVMIIMGALATVYAFCYCTGSLSTLAYRLNGRNESVFKTTDPNKYDATLYLDIQGFNDVLMYLGIVMIVFAVLLYITGCNKRRNYYITNYVATGVCAGGNIIISIILMAMNGVWMGRFKRVDFDAWLAYNDELAKPFIALDSPVPEDATYFDNSTTWFSIGFVVYALVIIASVLLILNLVWKILLMRGEKKLLNGANTVEVEGGATV